MKILIVNYDKMIIQNKEILIFDSPVQLSEALADAFIMTIQTSAKRIQSFNVALSGGSTPRLFFTRLREKAQSVSWQNVHFFWVDERCVPSDDNESNYGLTKNLLLKHIDIPSQNLNRIWGENDPETEAERYAELLRQIIRKRDTKIPVFDWILLGIGEDGHTASIFPGDLPVIHSNAICTVAIHPVTRQKRITLTLPVINHAERISFLVSGQNKSVMVRKILYDETAQSKYPAAMVQSGKTSVEWYLDKDAAYGL